MNDALTTVETWQLIFSGFTAVSTTLAVCLSLFFAFGKRKSFSIKTKDIRMDIWEHSLNTNTGEYTGQDNVLYVRLENHLEFEMRVLEIVVGYESKEKDEISGGAIHLLRQDQNIIPPYSQYDVKFVIPREAEHDSYKNAKRVYLTVKTSFGDKTITFPKKWLPQLAEIIEQK